MRPLVFLFLLLSATVYGQPATADIRLEQRLSILNDKAFLLLPAAAANVARNADIMSAGPNEDRETRIILDIGDKRLVFFAEELYATAGDNFAAQLQSSQGKNFTVKDLKRTDGIVAVLSTPQRFDTTKNAILVNSLIVKNTDHTLFRINAYINPVAFAERESFRALSEHVFTGLDKGSRTLSFKARTEFIPVLGGHKKLSVDLPEGYTISKDEKYVFEVLRFRKIKDFFDTTWVSLSVYLGHHPSFFYPGYDFAEDQQQRASGAFLGKNREWLLFKDEQAPLFLKEQQFHGELEKDLVIHIAMTTDRIKTMDELSGIVSTLKFADQ